MELDRGDLYSRDSLIFYIKMLWIDIIPCPMMFYHA